MKRIVLVEQLFERNEGRRKRIIAYKNICNLQEARRRIKERVVNQKAFELIRVDT